MAKLTDTDRHFMRLIVKDSVDGWTPVSSVMYSLVERMPKEIVDLERVGADGRVRLTPLGQSVYEAMDWLL